MNILEDRKPAGCVLTSHAESLRDSPAGTFCTSAPWDQSANCHEPACGGIDSCRSKLAGCKPQGRTPSAPATSLGLQAHVQSLCKHLWLHTLVHRSQLGIIKLTELSWPLIPCLGTLHFVNYPLASDIKGRGLGQSHCGFLSFSLELSSSQGPWLNSNAV